MKRAGKKKPSAKELRARKLAAQRAAETRAKNRAKKEREEKKRARARKLASLRGWETRRKKTREHERKKAERRTFTARLKKMRAVLEPKLQRMIRGAEAGEGPPSLSRTVPVGYKVITVRRGKHKGKRRKVTVYASPDFDAWSKAKASFLASAKAEGPKALARYRRILASMARDYDTYEDFGWDIVESGEDED